jgi:hypothetical protein
MYGASSCNMSCGVLMLHNLSGTDPKDGLKWLFVPEKPPKVVSKYAVSNRPAQPKRYTFYTFSDNTNNKSGIQLAEFIRKNDLGDVIETKPTPNVVYPEGGRRIIQVWVWTPDYPKLDAFLETIKDE